MKIRRAILLCVLVVPVTADEGLWLFNQFPKDQVKQKYSFEVSDAFLEKLRLASLRIGDSAGSFVSPNGLIFTTWRAASGCAALRDHLKDGFSAASGAEASCPGLEAEVLVRMEDVTKAVKDAAANTPKAAEALQKRTAAIARIEKACAEKAGSCAVVKLFSGERYDLYEYKKYTDLRLVFAPEAAIARFGGDAGNFTYPRYDLDVAFLRAYENGKPADTPHFVKWSAEGVKDAELIFVTGNPAATARLATAAQLTFYRDTALPVTLARLRDRVALLRDFSAKSADNQRAAERLLSDLGNAYKAEAGRYIGLKDDRLMARKTNFDRRLRSSVERDPKLGNEAGKVWDEVAAAYKAWAPMERPYQVLERPAAQGSVLFAMARAIVRGGTPPAVVYDEALETALIAQYLEDVKALGEKEAPLKQILAGKTTQQAAEEFVHGSKPKDPEGMVRLVRLLEEPARKLRKKHEDTIQALETSAAERIAQYRYKVYGAADYPDATATPRVSFGSVKPYHDKTEAAVPFATTFGGLFHLAGPHDPFQVPQRWVDARPTLDLVAPFNFVSTADIAAGEAGAPAVNTKGELVGMVFDGNIESLALTYIYSDDQARAVHVATQGVVEAIGKLYREPALLRELGVATQP